MLSKFLSREVESIRTYFYVFLFTLLTSILILFMHTGTFNNFRNLFADHLSFDHVVLHLSGSLQFTMILLAAFCGLLYYNYINTNSKLEIIRVRKPKLYLLKKAMSYSAKIALSVYLALTLLVIFAYFLYPIDKHFYSAFLISYIPESIYQNNRLIFVLVLTFIKAFCSVFFNSIVACGFAVLAKKKANAFLYPIVYIIGLSMLLTSVPKDDLFGIPFTKYYVYLQPPFLTSPDHRADILISGIILSVVALIAAFLILFKIYFRRKDY